MYIIIIKKYDIRIRGKLYYSAVVFDFCFCSKNLLLVVGKQLRSSIIQFRSVPIGTICGTLNPHTLINKKKCIYYPMSARSRLNICPQYSSTDVGMIMMQTGMVKQGLNSVCHTYLDGTNTYTQLNQNMFILLLPILNNCILLIAFSKYYISTYIPSF